MPISLTFDPSTNRWTITYGEWTYELHSTDRNGMRDEMFGLGADLPDAAIALLDLLRPTPRPVREGLFAR